MRDYRGWREYSGGRKCVARPSWRAARITARRWHSGYFRPLKKIPLDIKRSRIQDSAANEGLVAWRGENPPTIRIFCRDICPRRSFIRRMIYFIYCLWHAITSQRTSVISPQLALPRRDKRRGVRVGFKLGFRNFN